MMERYEKYKGSGVEWIGEIPEGWEVKKVKELMMKKVYARLNEGAEKST